MTEAPESRLDAGSAMVIGACALFLLSCLLPWYGKSLTTVASGPSFSVVRHVSAGGPGWLLVVGIFVVTALVTVGRSKVAVIASLACGALLVVGVAELVRRFPTLSVPPDLGHGSAPLTRRTDARLLGAALGVLAAGLAVVGVLIHSIVCVRTWRQRASAPVEAR